MCFSGRSLSPSDLIQVRCSVKGQAPWQIKLKTRAERCTGIYEPVAELVNGRPCYKKVGSDKDGDGQVWLCYTSNGPGHERYMIQHVRVKGHSKGYARCKLTDTSSSSSNSSSSSHGGSPLVVPAPHQVALWQVKWMKNESEGDGHAYCCAPYTLMNTRPPSKWCSPHDVFISPARCTTGSIGRCVKTLRCCQCCPFLSSRL
jgi:hypothetical protein